MKAAHSGLRISPSLAREDRSEGNGHGTSDDHSSAWREPYHSFLRDSTSDLVSKYHIYRCCNAFFATCALGQRCESYRIPDQPAVQGG